MNDNLRNALSEICRELTQAIEFKFQQEPFGCCYLFGHCLAEGLSNAGFLAEEHTGHLILKDKVKKDLVYGTAKYKGKLVGYYHTWCVLKDGEYTIIIDPSLLYNKIALKKHYGIKVNINIPDVLISNEPRGMSCVYIRDEKLVSQSKKYLRTIRGEDLKELIDFVTRATLKLTANHNTVYV